MREGGAVMLRQLKYFQSVVRRNSFSAAAEENFISQSAVSQQIQALERELRFQGDSLAELNLDRYRRESISIRRA